jgi:hypothetical protein
MATSAAGKVLDRVGAAPQIVVATPGAEPVADDGCGAALLGVEHEGRALVDPRDRVGVLHVVGEQHGAGDGSRVGRPRRGARGPHVHDPSRDGARVEPGVRRGPGLPADAVLELVVRVTDVGEELVGDREGLEVYVAAAGAAERGERVLGGRPLRGRPADPRPDLLGEDAQVAQRAPV